MGNQLECDKLNNKGYQTTQYIYDIKIRNVVFAFCMNQKAGVGLEGAVAASGLAIKNTRSLVGRR